MNKSSLLPWVFLLLLTFLLCWVGISLDKPMGTISGKIAIEQEKFHQYSYDIKSHKVYVLATGPRSSSMQERGVWVNSDGTFKLSHLPIGEYSLKVRATGYATNYQSGIFVDEGKITELPKAITMSILDPSVNIASNCRVFTSKEQPHFWINATGADKAVVHLYKKDFLSLLKLTSSGNTNNAPDIQITPSLDLYKTSQNTPIDLFKNDAPVVTLERKLEQDQEDSSHAEFKIAKALPAGDYIACVEVSNPENKHSWNMLWFSVSDLGLVIKKDSQKTIVRAVDLNSLHGIPGVAIDLLLRSDKSAPRTVTSAITGPNGIVQIDTKGSTWQNNQNILAVGNYGLNRAYGGMYSWQSANASGYQTYFYTERPVYRLGQTVYYKGICRMLDASGLHNQTDMTLKAVIEDPDNNTIWQGKLQTNDHGTFHGTFDIPVDGKTGGYQLTLTYPNGTTDSESFEIAQYRKPEYQVEVTALTPQTVAGANIKARVKATYFFGAPVRNARIKYSIYAANDWDTRLKLMPHPAFYDYFDDWGTDGLYSEGDAGDYITEGYGQTDDNGEAIIAFDSKKLALSADSPFDTDYSDKRYKIQAEVTDISRMSVIGSGYCSVTEGNFALFVQPEESVIKAGGKFTTSFTAVSYDNHPVANQKVSLELSRWIYDSKTSTYKGRQQIAQAIATTGADGKGKVSFTTSGALPCDTYYISAKALDAQGHLIFDQSDIWIASDNYPYMLGENAAQKQTLSIKLDKPAYKPGETAKVMITAPTTGTEGADAIVSVEGIRLYDYKLVPMNATAKLVEIPVTSEYEPNAFINVTYIGKNHQFYNESKILKVSPQEHFLKVAIATDKTKYKPGETVHYQLKATFPDGKPAPNTELSLGVVDESIYSIRPETAQDIEKFFYKRRENWVTTICSFPEQFSGGPDKTEPAVRKDFKDTAAWLPDLVTNKDGIVTAAVKLPDNLTTWRATVRGVDLQTNIGYSINKVICTQDLILRLALPRFFTQGDEGAITAIVHNYTDTPQTVHLSLSATPQFKTDQALNQDVKVDPEKAQQYSWKVKVVGSGQATILAKAIGQTASDALQRTLPVNMLGISDFSSQSGLLSKDTDSASIPIKLAPGTQLSTANCQLSLAPSSIGPVLGNYTALIDYPYGCTEQTMDRLIPSIVSMSLHNKLGVPIDSKMTAKFNQVYKQSMSKLTDYHHADGGWGWWENDESSPYLTSLVMEGFYLLKQTGYAVDNDQAMKGRDWLSRAETDLLKQLMDPKHMKDLSGDIDTNIDFCKMLYTSTLWNQHLNAQAKTWLESQINKLAPEALSYMTIACNNDGDKKLAQKLYRRLIDIVNKDGDYLDWDHSRALQTQLGLPSTSYDYTFRFTGVETTALALKAVLAADPQNTKAIESIKSWLLLQRDKDGWQNTKTTAQVFMVLLEEELAAKQHNPTGFTATATLGSTNLASIAFDEATMYVPEKTINVPVSATPQNLNLSKTGSGRLYYSNLITYIRNLKPGDTVNAKSLPTGVKLSRSFFRLVPSAVTSDGKIHFHTEPITNSTITAGETVLMKVSLDTPVALPYVIVEAALPSGGEVVSDDPRQGLASQSGDDDSNIIGDWGQWWWTHEDVLDDRLVFFVTNLKAGRSEFHTMVRMELPGTYQMNPIHMEGMYTKHVRAYSALDSLKVTN